MNGTCDQCLCFALSFYTAVNCFPNNTCQLFSTFPLYYHIDEILGARLYFPKQMLPSASQCCMPNITYLVNKLTMANIISQTVSNPRDAVIDDDGYFVTIERYANYLDRFDPLTLMILDHKALPSSQYMTITYFNSTYYTAPYYASMTLIDSENLAVLTSISTSTYGIRDIMFLNDGATMVVTSCDTNSLVFLNRTSLAPITYTFNFLQATIINSCPHGMWRVNDTFFYLTYFSDNSLHAFSATSNYTSWNDTVVFSTATPSGSAGASHVTIDECGRFWFTYEKDTVLIYNQQGILLSNWTIPNTNIFDIKIMNNYLMYLTDSNLNRIMRIDPEIEC